MKFVFLLCFLIMSSFVFCLKCLMEFISDLCCCLIVVDLMFVVLRCCCVFVRILCLCDNVICFCVLVSVISFVSNFVDVFMLIDFDIFGVIGVFVGFSMCKMWMDVFSCCVV